MNNVHGMVFAYQQFPALGELGTYRTAGALPFCGRYRLIDFALSNMMNAGISNVDVLMQIGYQSLIDHMSGGRPWNMVRHSGGLHLMPIGMGRGPFSGTMDALETIRYHLESDIQEDYILMTRGGLVANMDFNAMLEDHMASGADVTAVCTDLRPNDVHNRFLLAEDGKTATELLCRQKDDSRGGLAALATYVLRKDKLLEMLNWCSEGNRTRFHRNAMIHFMEQGMKVNIYHHKTFARYIGSVQDYFSTNMAMLDPKVLEEVFPPERPVATRARSDVSTYYGDNAKVTDSLIADGCIIEGNLDHCIVFRGAHIESGAQLKNCIVMNDADIGAGAHLENVVMDKFVNISGGAKLYGDPTLPLVVPKSAKI